MKKQKPIDQVKQKNPTVGFRPNPDVKVYLADVEKQRPGVERSDVVNTAISLAAQHAEPAALLKLLDKRALENEAAALEAKLTEVRAALTKHTEGAT